MEAVDGNALGALLHEVFSTEMTGAPSVCGTCSEARPVAELVVYLHAPGTVVRCRTCGSRVFSTEARRLQTAWASWLAGRWIRHTYRLARSTKVPTADLLDRPIYKMPVD